MEAAVSLGKNLCKNLESHIIFHHRLQLQVDCGDAA